MVIRHSSFLQFTKNVLGEFMAGELHDNAEAQSIAPKGAESPRLVVSNADMSTFFQGDTSKPGTTAVADRERAMFGNGFSFYQAASPYGNDVIAQGFRFHNPVDAYKKEFEHRYRGGELETMNKDIPAKAWDKAYKAFPELKQLGEKDATRLMKAITANELEHYDPLDLGEDAAAKTGHGGGLHGKTIGYGQISPDGFRDIARQLDKEVQSHQRTSNPLAKFEKMNNDQLAQELVNPANTPLFVAAHVALDLHTLNRHKNELPVTPESLGYFYNADMAYAKSDKHHEHLLTKKEAQAKNIPYDPALPTDDVLHRSEHAANIRKWLEKVG